MQVIMDKQWLAGLWKEYDSKVHPHLSRKWLYDGFLDMGDEYMVVQSRGTEFYLEITPDENGLPILPERASWKLYAGD